MLSRFLSFFFAAAVFAVPLAAHAEINAGVDDPNEGKVAEEINPDNLPWLGEGIAKCTVDDPLLQKDANSMGYYYSQKKENRKNFAKGYNQAVVRYRKSKVECLQKVITQEFGAKLHLKTALIFSDFREAIGRLKSWGVYFQQQMPPVCPYEQEKMNTCAEYLTRMQRDAQMGWAMQRLADDLGKQAKITTAIELGEAFARANRSLPKK